MHKIENILFGISLILFGIASILIAEYNNGGGLFEICGLISPFLGLGFTIFGLLNDGPKDKTEE